MGALFYSETPDHPVFADAKYKIGETVKIVRVNISDPSNYIPETVAVFQACVGRQMKIKEIMAWEEEENTYSISYEFHVAHLNGEANCNSYMESVYLNEDEIAPLRKRK